MRQLILTLVISLPLALIQVSAAGAADESAKSRPEKQEIIDLMVQLGRTPEQQRNERAEATLKGLASSATPRSDFMFCTGLAYLGNHNAQKCVASAYEHGRGIVEDPTEAFVWYAIAQHTNPSEPIPQVESLKMSLVANYPAPSEEELDEMVKKQQDKIAEYQEEAKKNKQ